MKRPDPATERADFDRNAFLVLLVVLTVAFAWIVLPFYGGVFWAAVLALLFEPMYLRLAVRMGGRRNLAALATIAVILVMVILPVILVSFSLVREAAGLYHRIKSGQLDLGSYFSHFIAVLPAWATELLAWLGVDDLGAAQAKLTAAITQRSQALTSRALDFGQDALDVIIAFVIAMYILFFLLRDGETVAREIRAAIPLATPARERLIERFTTVVRATVKGNLLVAAAQGALGGIAFWVLGVHAPVLWAVLMGFLSLLPAIGGALVWVPVTIYLLAVGQTWQGIGLLLFCVFGVGLIDNVLRPILVSKDTKLPDYIILVSTLGGLAAIGINGFVIGPVIAALFLTAWQLLATEHRRADAP